MVHVCQHVVDMPSKRLAAAYPTEAPTDTTVRSAPSCPPVQLNGSLCSQQYAIVGLSTGHFVNCGRCWVAEAEFFRQHPVKLQPTCRPVRWGQDLGFPMVSHTAGAAWCDNYSYIMRFLEHGAPVLTPFKRQLELDHLRKAVLKCWSVNWHRSRPHLKTCCFPQWLKACEKLPHSLCSWWWQHNFRDAAGSPRLGWLNSMDMNE